MAVERKVIPAKDGATSAVVYRISGGVRIVERSVIGCECLGTREYVVPGLRVHHDESLGCSR